MSSKENQNDSDKNDYEITKPGSLKKQIKIPDDFDAPMTPEELALWYDNPVFPDNDESSKKTTNK